MAAVLSQFEESTPSLLDMNPSARPLTSRNRDQALARLNSITTGTAIAAAIATGGFGALAAATWSGSTGTTDTTTGITTSGTSSQLNPPAAALGATATQAPSAAAGLQATRAPAAVVTKKAKVTSGGSH